MLRTRLARLNRERQARWRARHPGADNARKKREQKAFMDEARAYFKKHGRTSPALLEFRRKRNDQYRRRQLRKKKCQQR